MFLWNKHASRRCYRGTLTRFFKKEAFYTNMLTECFLAEEQRSLLNNRALLLKITKYKN